MRTFTLRLRRLPTDLFVRNRRHLDDLVHELHVVAVGRDSGLEIDPRLAEAIDAILEEFAGPREAVFVAARDAFLSGQREIDIDLTLPVAAVEKVRQALELLEEVEDLSRRGVLLTLPAPPDLWALRRWVEREVKRQAAGQDPQPFRPDTTDGE
jgi:hypothetical protein